MWDRRDIRRWVLVLLVGCCSVVLGCHGSVDPTRPVALVVDERELGQRQRAALPYAAEGWNLELGTRVSITTSAEVEDDAQRVAVVRSKDVCSRASGLAHLDGARIELCATLNEPADLLVVTRHEIGHILGLGHAEDDKEAVMWPRRQRLVPRFKPADHELFADAHPGFVAEPGRVAVPGGEALAPPALVVTGGATFVAWATLFDVRLQRIDPRSGRALGAPRQLVTLDGIARHLVARAEAETIHLTWVEHTSLMHLAVATTGGRLPDALGDPRRLDLVTLPPPGLLRAVSTALHEGDLFIATSRQAGPEQDGYWTSRGVQLHRLDPATGDPRELDYDSLGAQVTEGGPPLYWGVELARFAPAGRRGLYLVQLERSRPVVHLLVDGGSRGRLELAIDRPATDLVSVADGERLVLTWRQKSQPDRLTLQVVTLDEEGQLVAGARRTLSLPQPFTPPPASLALQGSRLVVALHQPLPGWTAEVLLASLDAETLTGEGTWRRLSAVDLIGATAVDVALWNEGVVVGWLDQPLQSGQPGSIRLRAVSLP